MIARPVPDGGLELEGHRLEPVELGHTDTDDTTGLWVPSIGLFARRGTRSTTECTSTCWRPRAAASIPWLAAIDKIEALHPRAVVAGHKAPGGGDGPEIIGETRQYLLDARQVLAAATKPGRTTTTPWSAAIRTG